MSLNFLFFHLKSPEVHNFFILITENKAAPPWAHNPAFRALQLQNEFSICLVLLMVTWRL